MKRIFHYPVQIALIATFFILSACSTDVDSIDSRTAVSSFVRENPDIFAFGSVDVEEILIKANYNKVPKLGTIIGGEIQAMNDLLDMDVPVYYAIQGPMDNEGIPAAIYAFLKVKDQDKLVENLEGRGFHIDKSGDVKVGQDEGYAVGVRGSLAIIVVKEGDFDGKQFLADAFKKTEGDPASDKVNEILDAKGDIVMGVSVESLYKTSDTDLSDLSKDKQKQLEEMVKDSYVQSAVSFENGAAILETKNFFSPELKKRMFFKSDGGAAILSKLGSGSPRIGFAANIDMKKLKNFMDEFSPDAMDDLTRSMGGMVQFAMAAGGSDGIAGLFDGRLGLLMFGNGGMEEPQFNIFVGLKKNGVGLAELGRDFIGNEAAVFNVSSDGAQIFTSDAFAKGGKVKLPKGCENFGKSGISAFISFDGIDYDDMDLSSEQNFVRAIQYVTFEYNNDGGKIYVKARDGKENVLEQIIKEMMSAMTTEIGHMSI